MRRHHQIRDDSQLVGGPHRRITPGVGVRQVHQACRASYPCVAQPLQRIANHVAVRGREERIAHRRPGRSSPSPRWAPPGGPGRSGSRADRRPVPQESRRGTRSALDAGVSAPWLIVASEGGEGEAHRLEPRPHPRRLDRLRHPRCARPPPRRCPEDALVPLSQPEPAGRGQGGVSVLHRGVGPASASLICWRYGRVRVSWRFTR
jgi:hypothetical protein